jgi:hypothetical protein
MAASARARHGDRGHAGRGGIRHRHHLARRDGLYHGAPVPFQHLPGRRLHAGRRSCASVHRHAGEGGQSDDLHRRGQSARSSPPRRAKSLDESDRPGGPADQVSRGAAHLDDLDLNPLLVRVDTEGAAAALDTAPSAIRCPTLDAQILKDAEPFSKAREDAALYDVKNTTAPSARGSSPPNRAHLRCGRARRTAS